MDIVVFLPAGEWEINTRQRMLIALAKALEDKREGGRILCIERPICPVSTMILHPRRFIHWARGRKPLRQITKNLFVMTPWALIHDLVALNMPILAKANNMIQGAEIRRAIKLIGTNKGKLVVWVYHPYQQHYCDMLKKDLFIYEVYDEYREAVGGSSNQWLRGQMERSEKRILQKADIVLTTAKKLFRRLSDEHSHVYLVPNGVDFDHFAKIPPDTPPRELINIRSPRLGFMGNVRDIVDYSLLDHLAINHPEWSIILLGRCEIRLVNKKPDFLRLKSRPNVYFWGWIDYAMLPKYVHTFDVCLIPYVVNEFTKSIYPLKLQEYLAAGKPVVSTALPEMEQFVDIIRIARNHLEFESAIIESLREKDEGIRKQRINIAQKNTWMKRAENILSIIEEALQK